MGFTPRSTVYTLDFEGTEYNGLEVKMRATKLGALFGAPELLGIKERIDAGGSTLPAADDLDRIMDQYRELAEHLVSWNLEIPAGTPVPATLDGLKALEVPLVNVIAQTWRTAMGEVAPPLSGGSSSGPLPDVLSVPMAPIPESLLSSSTPS